MKEGNLFLCSMCLSRCALGHAAHHICAKDYVRPERSHHFPIPRTGRAVLAKLEVNMMKDLLCFQKKSDEYIYIYMY